MFFFCKEFRDFLKKLKFHRDGKILKPFNNNYYQKDLWYIPVTLPKQRQQVVFLNITTLNMHVLQT